MNSRIAAAALLWTGALTSGCGSSPFDDTLLLVQVDNAGTLSADGRRTAAVTLVHQADGRCPLSASAILTVGQQSWPFGSCFVGDVPVAGNDDLDIRIWDGPGSSDQGQAVVGALAPGFDAAIASPLSDTTTPGGEILVSLPAALRDLQPTLASFVYLGMDDPTYAGENTTVTLDAGDPFMTVRAPQHTGPFRFSVPMTSSDPTVAGPDGVVVSCFGFSKCVAVATPDVGPLAITVAARAP